MAVIAERQDEEHRIRVSEFSQAACVPYMKKDDRERFFKSLAKNEPETQNVGVDELEKINETMKNFLKSNRL